MSRPGRRRAREVVDNFLEAASENILIGGGDPPDRKTILRGLKVYRNHVYKRAEWRDWRSGGPDPRRSSVKNLLQLKCGIDADVEGNLFDRSWRDGNRLVGPQPRRDDPDVHGARTSGCERTSSGTRPPGSRYQYRLQSHRDARPRAAEDNLFEIAGRFIFMTGGLQKFTIQPRDHSPGDGISNISNGVSKNSPKAGGYGLWSGRGRRARLQAWAIAPSRCIFAGGVVGGAPTLTTDGARPSRRRS